MPEDNDLAIGLPKRVHGPTQLGMPFVTIHPRDWRGLVRRQILNHHARPTVLFTFTPHIDLFIHIATFRLKMASREISNRLQKDGTKLKVNRHVRGGVKIVKSLRRRFVGRL